jgi:hypothetical protein
MSRSKNPVVVILSLTILGVLVTAIARFAYLAYILIESGESLTSVPLDVLLLDVMELHWAAGYGALGGAVLGIILVLADLIRYGGRSDDYSFKDIEDYKPFTEDKVKAHRMETGDHYLKENPPEDGDGDTR